jgi:hypothetical protein
LERQASPGARPTRAACTCFFHSRIHCYTSFLPQRLSLSSHSSAPPATIQPTGCDSMEPGANVSEERTASIFWVNDTPSEKRTRQYGAQTRRCTQTTRHHVTAVRSLNPTNLTSYLDTQASEYRSGPWARTWQETDGSRLSCLPLFRLQRPSRCGRSTPPMLGGAPGVEPPPHTRYSQIWAHPPYINS